MGVPKLSTGAIKGMLISHATKNMGWTETEIREAFDEWFAGCPLHRQRVEDSYSDHANGADDGR